MSLAPWYLGACAYLPPSKSPHSAHVVLQDQAEAGSGGMQDTDESDPEDGILLAAPPTDTVSRDGPVPECNLNPPLPPVEQNETVQTPCRARSA